MLAELRKIANENNLDLVSLPTYFEVRWTEFSAALFEAVLRSWAALVRYFQQSKEKASKGFQTFLLDEDNLRLIAFITDLLFVFSRFQKQLQANSTTVLDMKRL